MIMIIGPSAWLSRTWTVGRDTSVFLPTLERLRGTPARAEELLRATAADVRTRRASGWSAQQHVGHLADLHALDDRRLTEYLQGVNVLTRADTTNAATERAGHNDASAIDVLARLRRGRTALVQRLETLSIQEAQRTATHPRLEQRLTLVDWMFLMAEHDDHHLAHARYRIWSAREA
jgi:hypothetical protein